MMLTYRQQLEKYRERDMKMIAAYLGDPNKLACEIYRKHRISRARFYKILDKHGVQRRNK